MHVFANFAENDISFPLQSDMCLSLRHFGLSVCHIFADNLKKKPQNTLTDFPKIWLKH